jgi:hypothetical protein
VNEGKNSWSVAWNNNEQIRVRTDITKELRLTSAHEFLYRGVGMLDYYSIDMVFAMYRWSGECISADLKYPDGRKTSNRMVFNFIDSYSANGYCPYGEGHLDNLLYLKAFYDKVNNKALTLEEYTQFKRMYHALQRGSIETVLEILKDFAPKGLPIKK